MLFSPPVPRREGVDCVGRPSPDFRLDLLVAPSQRVAVCWQPSSGILDFRIRLQLRDSHGFAPCSGTSGPSAPADTYMFSRFAKDKQTPLRAPAACLTTSPALEGNWQLVQSVVSWLPVHPTCCAFPRPAVYRQTDGGIMQLSFRLQLRGSAGLSPASHCRDR